MSSNEDQHASLTMAGLSSVKVVPVYTNFQKAGLLIGPLVFVISGFAIPTFDRERPQANVMLAITLLTTTWWVTDCVPLPIASLVPYTLLPFFGIVPGGEVASLYMNYIIFLFIGAFLMGKAIEKSNLHKRIALKILTRVGHSPKVLLLAFMSVAWLLSMFCSNTSTTALLIPFVTGVLHDHDEDDESKANPTHGHDARFANPTSNELYRHEDSSQDIETRSGSEGYVHVQENGDLAVHEKEDYVNNIDPEKARLIQSNFAKGILIGVAFGATSGGIATLIGTPVNSVLVAQVAQKFGVTVTFLQWFTFGAPLACIILFVAWLALTWAYLPSNKGLKAIKVDTEVFKAAQSKLGPVTRDEWVVGILQLVLVVLWFSGPYSIRPYIGTCTDPVDASSRDDCVGTWTSFVDDGTLACLVASILFFIPAQNLALHEDRTGPNPKFHEQRLLNANDIENLPWGLFLLFGAGFAISAGFGASGLSLVIGDALTALTTLPPMVMVLLLVLFVCFVTEFASNTAISNIVIAILAPVAVKAGINPYDMLVPSTLASSLAYMFPIATPPNAVVFATGRIDFTDMMKPGFVLNISASVLTTLWWFVAGRAMFQVEDNVLPDWACGGDIGCELVNGTAVFQ